MTEKIEKTVQTAVQETFADIPLPESSVPTLPWYRKLHIWWLIRWLSWRESRIKHFWVCHGYKAGQGIGHIRTPKPMTEAQAIKWLREATDGTIAYIDREVGFIFYKPKD